VRCIKHAHNTTQSHVIIFSHKPLYFHLITKLLQSRNVVTTNFLFSQSVSPERKNNQINKQTNVDKHIDALFHPCSAKHQNIRFYLFIHFLPHSIHSPFQKLFFYYYSHFLTTMAKPKAPKRTLESYPVKHMNKNIKGNCSGLENSHYNTIKSPPIFIYPK
jgi:hypothetical protein